MTKNRSNHNVLRSMGALIVLMSIFQIHTSNALSFAEHVLSFAAEYNLCNMTSFLLAYGGGLFTVDESMISTAARCGNRDVLRVFLRHCRIDEGMGSDALYYAICWRDRKMETMLLEAGANPAAIDNYNKVTMLMSAIQKGANRKVIKRILGTEKCLETINAGDKHGFTALIWAARRGALSKHPIVFPTYKSYGDVLEQLINKGASIDQRDNRGSSALMHAAGVNYIDGVRILLRFGADVNACDRDGWSALAECNRYEIGRVLLAHGADPDIPIKRRTYDNYGNETSSTYGTALISAIKHKRFDSAQLLLARGANPSIGDQTENVQQFVRENRYLRSEYLSFSEAELENAGLPQDVACVTVGMAYGDQAKDEVHKNLVAHRALKEKIRLKYTEDKLTNEAANIEGLE